MKECKTIGGITMEKEQVIAQLEEVFTHACARYVGSKGQTITEIRELGESILRSKQSIYKEIRKAEEFIDSKVRDALKNK